MNSTTTQKKRPPAMVMIPAIFCIILVPLVLLIISYTGFELAPIEPAADIAISARFNSLIDEAMLQAEASARSVPKKFWLNEDTLVAPVPNPDCYGETDSPDTLQWLLDDASTILDGQDTLFSTDIQIMPRSKVIYYLDDSIFAVTWKQNIAGTTYTISEIKVGHPSQFRRYVSDGVYDSPKLYIPSVMSRKVNAVVGSSADHYRGRRRGIIVYDGEVKRVDAPETVDICYINDNGDLIFSYRGELNDIEEAQAFVDKNDIQFSISFGPVLIDNGVRCEPPTYVLGEVNDNYARAALCQLDTLHYLVIAANAERGAMHSPNIHEFAEVLDTFGCQKAYTLDGGNTGSIVMNGNLINRTPFGYERAQGDLIYFCTAVPD